MTARAITRRRLLRTAAMLAAAPASPAFARDRPPPDDPVHGWRAGTVAGFEDWVDARLKEAEAAIAAMSAGAGNRTVAGTLERYDRARNALAMAANQAQLLGIAGATAAFREAARRSSDAVNTAAVALDLDPQVHAALRELSTTAELRRSDAATRHYVERALLRGRLVGADRDAATRARVQEIRNRIIDIEARYMRNLQQQPAAVETTVQGMKGLPADILARHRPDARGVVTLAATPIDMLPVMRFADDPDLRRRMHLAYENQVFPANAAVLVELVGARAALARALGFASYADLTLADQMIGSAAAAVALLDRIDAVSRPIADRHVAAVQAFAHSVDPVAVVTAADATYWTERYNRDRFGIDGQDLRAYLPFARVQAGIMDFAARFFGVRFTPVGDGAAWHPQVAVFDVHAAAADRRGVALGRIYLDAHPRPGKDRIFATAPLVPGIRDRQRPEGAILCNLPGGDPDDPGLLSHADVVNFLHEFGHLMHHILAGQGRWSALGAFDTEEDFLEAPSQMLEEFARDPAVLQRFARHYRTGEALPAAMIDRLDRSAAFARAGWIRSQLQRARFALAIHRMPGDADTIEAEHRSAQWAAGGYAEVAGTHPYAASPHLVGYGPNYYMYLLDKVIAVDFAARFPRGDPTAGDIAAAYRRRVLAPGAGRPADSLIRDFLGRDQRLDALSAWLDGASGRR